MFKKLLCICLSITALLSFGFIANAQDDIDMNSMSNIQPYYNYVVKNDTSMSISNGQALCRGTLTGCSGTTTKVTITMYFEKKTLWWWSTEASCTGSFDSYHGTLSKNYSVTKGTYRVRAVYVAYSGNKSETITGYSQEVKY
ncbi:MAG TPA: hypothetical protein VFC76_06675 [Oscillospiraceae bacterium]|nr:hypothetical protein [Oscillospiraceae bacterium]